ncbi:MAG: rhodanese-like domain-containing protein [Spirochaetota bacterium]
MKDIPLVPISAGALLIALVLFVLIGKRTQAADANISHITAKEAMALITTNKGAKNFVILDVRTPNEFAEGHIAGATNIDYYAPDFKERIAKLDKKKTYLILCRSGNRSGKSAAFMSESGYTGLFNMKGGMMGWEFDRLPVSRK